MATGKATFAIDEIIPKTPGATGVSFDQPAGNKTSKSLADLTAFQYVTKEMFQSNYPIGSNIEQDIPANNDGFYIYTYDGSLGPIPAAVLQIRTTTPILGWTTVAQATLLDDGTILVRADFSSSTGDTYRLLIKP